MVTKGTLLVDDVTRCRHRYAYRMAVLLPAGRTFLISRQLRGVESGMPPQHRAYGYQLIGAKGSTPVIKVADGTDPSAFPSLFNTTLVDGRTYEARPVLRYAVLLTPDGGNDSSSLYSALLRNVDFDLGNNPSLSAVVCPCSLPAIVCTRVASNHHGICAS